MRFWNAGVEKEVVIGKALPYALYGADRKQLIAAGEVVANAVVRDYLHAYAVYASDIASLSGADELIKYGVEKKLPAVLAALSQAYSSASKRIHFGFKMSHNEASPTHPTLLVGVLENGNFVLTVPQLPDGSPLPVAARETWLFRAFYVTSALRFRAAILDVAVAPFAHLYVGPPQNIERQNIRRWPRVQLCIPAVPDAAGDVRFIVVDLSVGGARLAAEARAPLQKGQRVTVQLNLPLMQTEFPITLEAQVRNLYGHADPQQPEVTFYGLLFEKPSQQSMLILHGFVQEQMTAELDRVSQLLAQPSSQPAPKQY
jgi:hypothetical protein